MKEFWTGLTQQQQIVTAIIIIVIAYIALNYGKNRKQVFDRVLASKSEEQVLQSMGITPTHTTQYFNQQATKIETAISGWGTDEAAVLAVFKTMQNDADLLQLEKAFGIREETDLSGWLYGDLSGYYIDLINSQLILNGASRQY